MRKTLLLATSALALAGAAHAEAPFGFDRTPGQLPKSVVPDAYRIDITPDLQSLRLSGSEAIDLHVRTASPDIVLNQAGLALQSAKLEDGTAAAGIVLDEKKQTATLHFAQAVAVGRHTLSIVYTGPIPNTPNGIYYDDYKTPAGATKRMLVTQFEVADARRMFPGWDEPSFKATFTLTTTLPRGLAVISNMPAASSKDVEGGLTRTVFATSPRMSTYLVALLAGDLSAVRGVADGTQMAAWAPTGEQDQGQDALGVEERVLPYYNTYFGVKYPLPKLDLIAVPGNYEAGAMENWGAITFIDNAMLFDPATSSPETHETIANVVAHEMAHQWSGDLVTMGWWDNIWLNEGFATWMATKVTAHLNPGWEIWPRQHAVHEAAMAQDALPSTHPVQQAIHDETEADSAFDQISYQKGAAILRMVEDWLSPDVFRDGMRRYMAAHQFGNTTSADLWAALGAASQRDVTSVAASFTEQPGVPLVHLSRSCSGDQMEITLTQDRFTINDPHPAAETWSIPVSYGEPHDAKQGESMHVGHIMLDSATAHVPLPGAACDAVVKANVGENGYYRTQYDAASLQALTRGVTQLDATDRANLLGDQFAFYVANRAPLAEYMDLLVHDAGEQNIAVWSDTLSHLARLDTALIGSPVRAKFHVWAANYIRPEAGRLGWDARPGESVLDGVLRPMVIRAMGLADDAATIAEAHTRFDAFVRDPASLPPALREPVLLIVGRTADQATYDTLKRLGVQATSTEEKLRYFDALAAARDPKLMAQSVEFAGSGEVPNGRITAFLASASQLSENAGLLYRLVVPSEQALATHLPPSGLGPSVLVAAARGSSDPAVADELLAAASSNASRGAHIWAVRVADAIHTAAEMRGRTEGQMGEWLGK